MGQQVFGAQLWWLRVLTPFCFAKKNEDRNGNYQNINNRRHGLHRHGERSVVYCRLPD